MATIGQALTAPESGWRRYDDTDSRMRYNGTGWLVDHSSEYNATGHYTSNPGDSITFKFYGTKLRLIGVMHPQYCTVGNIYIDGVLDNFTERGVLVYQSLNYEKNGLTLGVHTITISFNDAGLLFDAIDIDSTGYLVHPILNQISDINTMQVGDVIPCRYTATTSGVAGYFSELGTCTANEIPVTGTATPDGLFYLIKTDKGTLIADRVMQTNISWDVLNTAKYIENNINSASYTKLLIRMNNSIFKDEIGHTVVNSNVALDSTNKIFGNESAYFNGNSYLSILNDSDWDFGNDNFTVDFCMKIPSIPTASKYILDSRAADGYTRFIIYLDSSGKINFAITNNGTSWTMVTSSQGLSINTDCHIAIVRYNNLITVYFNGISVGSTTFTGAVTVGSGNLIIGNYLGGGYGLTGNINKFRISKRLARWTTTFTPPSQCTLELPQHKIRSLSGGCAYADANGNSSLTNQGFGAWPSINEWDKYIVSSDLNGKITKGDNNIWNWNNGCATWCKDSVLLNLVCSNGTVTKNTRSIRGSFLGQTSNILSINNEISYFGNLVGFRPVLNYVELDITNEVIY